MYINKRTMLELFLLGVNAFLALPVIIIGISKKQKSTILTLSLFFGILAFYYAPPLNDLTRLMDEYKDFIPSKIDLNQLRDFLLTSLYLLGKNFNLDPHFLGFTAAFVLYYFLIKMTCDILNRQTLKLHIYYLYFFLYISFIPFDYFSGIRYTTGLILFIYGTYNYFYKNNTRIPYVYFLLSIASHYSLALPVSLFILYNIIFKKINSPMFWIILLVSSFILGKNTSLFLDQIINSLTNLKGLLQVNISTDSYLTGKWGKDFLQNANAIGVFVYNTKINLIVLLVFANTLLRVGKNATKLDKYVFFMSSFLMLLPEFRTLFDRFSHIVLFFILLTNTNETFFKNKLNKTNIIMFIFILFVVYSKFFGIKSVGYIFVDSYGLIYNISGFKMIIENIF